MASATFREAEASTKINNLRAILGTGEPVPVVATEPVGQPQAAASQSDSTTLAEDRADAWTYKPFAEPEIAQHAEFTKQLYSDDTGKAGEPIAPLSGPDSQATTYGVVEEGQFISHDPQEPKSVLEIAQDSFKAAMEPQPKPYADRPHWQKPTSLTWSNGSAKAARSPIG